MSALPEPKAGSPKILRFLGHGLDIAGSAAGGPAYTFIKLIIQELNLQALERDIETLLDEIEKLGINRLDDLTPGQRERFLPPAYRFIEQVRIRDYRHNLKVLASLIGKNIISDASDPGIPIRAARRLEMMSYQELVALSHLPAAFRISEEQSTLEPKFHSLCCISDSHLKDAFEQDGHEVSFYKCTEWLHELALRGLLTVGASGQHIGGIFYYRNAAYTEVIDSVRSGIDPDAEAAR